jgi:phytoene synthase
MIRDAIGEPFDERLSLFRDRLHEIHDGSLELPLLRFRTQEQHALHAIARTVGRSQIPNTYFQELAEGYRIESSVKRYATWSSLEKFCYHTGGVVGLIVAAVLGVTHSGAGAHAVELGNAVRFTAILCNLKTDWASGRLCLPLQDLVRFGYREKDIGNGVVNAAFRELMAFEVARARELFRRGSEGICWLADDGSRLAVSAIVANYIGLLSEIERQGYDVFARRPSLSAGQKLRRMPTAWRLARRKPDQPLPRV